MAQVTGAYVTAKALQRLGVDTIFYIIGGPVTPILEEADALGIQMVDVRHEEAAAMAAHAYSRLRNKPGVCMTPSGPATINALPGVMNALADASPVIAIGGSAALYQRGTGAFQEMDQVALFAPATKLAVQATLTKRIPEHLGILFRRAMAGVKGPVYLDLPADVISDKVEDDNVVYPATSYHEPRSLGNPADVKKAIELLKTAQKPLVVTGSGIIWSDASQELQEFVEATGIPFQTTPQGRGVVPEDHDLSFPAAKSMAFREADVVLVIGTRANFILNHFRPPRWNPDARFIIANIDAEEVHHNRTATVGIVGDAKMVIRQLTEEARAAGLRFAKGNQWAQGLAAKNAANEERNESRWSSDAVPIDPMRMMKEVREVLDREGILVVDGHETLNFGRQSLPTHFPGHRLNAGTHGTMGISIPFGLGAKAAKPDKQVVVVCGDGSFGWLGMSFDSCVRNNLPVLVVINNNGGMTAAPKNSDRIKGHDLGWSDYQMVAQAFGGYGERVEKPEDLAPALQRGLAAVDKGQAALINVITDKHARSSTYRGFFGEAGEYSG